MAAIAHDNPTYRTLTLPVIAGVAVWPTSMLSPSDTDLDVGGIVAMTLLAFSPLVELLQLFIGAYLIRIVGRRLGGTAGLASIRTAIAWGNVPIAVIAILTAAFALVAIVYVDVDEQTFNTADWLQSNLVQAIVVAIQLVLVTWSFVIFLRGLATVQGYSTGRALASALIAWSIPAALLALAIVSAGFGDRLFDVFFDGLGAAVSMDVT